MAKYKGVCGKYFCGNEISQYGQENGYVDYATLAKAFDAVLNNNIISATDGIGYWEIENGGYFFYENADGERITETEFEELTEEQQTEYEEISLEIYQYYIISAAGARILSDYTDEIIFYNAKLDMYVWGVTHFGTSWDYVLTDIKCNTAA